VPEKLSHDSRRRDGARSHHASRSFASAGVKITHPEASRFLTGDDDAGGEL
jgi:hypothetical protein